MLLGQSAVFGTRLRLRAAARPAPAAGALLVEAAHKKGGGSSKNKDDSHAQRLGVKLYGDQPCIAGNIIIRQRGTTVRTPGPAPCHALAELRTASRDAELLRFAFRVVSRLCTPRRARRAVCGR